MEDNKLPEYRATDTVKISDADKRIRQLREAYLNGTLQVDSARLAQKIIDFEKQLDKYRSPLYQ